MSTVYASPDKSNNLRKFNIKAQLTLLAKQRSEINLLLYRSRTREQIKLPIETIKDTLIEITSLT